MHDILLLRISAILPEAISDGGIDSPTDTDLLLATYKGGSHLISDIQNGGTIMIKVNAMGDACPIPVVKTKNAIR